MRGDARAMGPRLQQVSLPVADDEKPIRLTLWRATDRTYKTATEALTRVETNVAAKVKDENPAPDFSREEPQTFSGQAVSYSLDQQAWEGRLRRVSALFTSDPQILGADDANEVIKERGLRRAQVGPVQRPAQVPVGRVQHAHGPEHSGTDRH